MPVRFAQHGNGASPRATRAETPSSGVLVEREHEVAALERALNSARAGSGRIVLVDGPAGSGKTRLLGAAEAHARQAGMRVVCATGRELERSFAFGALIQLFDDFWTGADAKLRAQLTTGPARLAGALLDGRPNLLAPPVNGDAYPVVHAFFRLVRNLVAAESVGSSEQPLAIVVDDAHWVDQPSLLFLAYLASRIVDLPVALLVAVLPGEEASDSGALMRMRGLSAAAVLHPSPLSRYGVEKLVRAEFRYAHGRFVEECVDATGGNPFLLNELLSQVRADRLAPDTATAGRLARMAPKEIVDAVSARLARMSPPERAVAFAVAVLGDGQPLLVAARLAELDPRAAAAAADSLAKLHVLNPGEPLSFVHPLIRSTVLASMSPLSRGQSRRRAAITLREDGSPPETIAAQLLGAPSERDPAAVGVLRQAAQSKLRSGDPHGAVGFLQRALEERPSSVLYPEILAELGCAEAQLGAPAASGRLEEAIKLTEDPTRRAELALERGRLLASQERHHEAAAAFDSGSRELAGNEGHLAAELDAEYVAAASHVPELEADALSRRTKMLDNLNGPPNARQRPALARALVLDGLRGGSRPEVRRLADLAWSDGALLHENPAPEVCVASLAWGLLFVDELERDLEICEQIRAGPREQSMAIQPATINYLRAWPRYLRGEIAGAVSDAEAALGVPDHCHRVSRAAYAALTCCRVLRGQLEHAERALAISGDGQIRTTTSHPFLLEARAQLRLAQRRPADALSDALQAGDILESEHGVTNPGVIAWRSTAALAEIALGRCDRAEALAAQELERAQHSGVTRVVIRDLRVLGLAGAKSGIELLEQAVHTAEHHPARLEGILALVDLGAALRRANRRTAAREPLRKALELSYRGGATFVAERARMELTAAGARPRRTMLSGLESLTPAERRVADVAAQEMTTREIAEALFITPKTVEYHLRHIYQKLHVSSRSELATALAAQPTD